MVEIVFQGNVPVQTGAQFGLGRADKNVPAGADQ